ncbi:hypothetical protein AKJ16_DCAP27579 [Drosera capensis]
MGGDIAMELYSFEGSSDLVNGVDIPPSTRSDAHGDDMGNAASWYDSDEEAGGPYGQERELQKRSEEMYNETQQVEELSAFSAIPTTSAISVASAIPTPPTCNDSSPAAAFSKL